MRAATPDHQQPHVATISATPPLADRLWTSPLFAMVGQSRTRCRRSNRVPQPRVGLNQVGRKHDERSAEELSPSLIEGWRNGREQGDTSLDRCLERAHEAVTGCFELSKLAQKNKIGPCCNVTSHRLGGGNGSRFHQGGTRPCWDLSRGISETVPLW